MARAAYDFGAGKLHPGIAPYSALLPAVSNPQTAISNRKLIRLEFAVTRANSMTSAFLTATDAPYFSQSRPRPDCIPFALHRPQRVRAFDPRLEHFTERRLVAALPQRRPHHYGASNTTSSPSIPISNRRTPLQLKSHATRTKQTPQHRSNRHFWPTSQFARADFRCPSKSIATEKCAGNPLFRLRLTFPLAVRYDAPIHAGAEAVFVSMRRRYHAVLF
jgi:hypothetical protein